MPLMVFKTFQGIMAISLLQTAFIANSAEQPTATPAAAPASAPANAAPVKLFPILEYQVEGNTLMRTIDIERAVMPYLGEGKSIKDVEAAQQTIIAIVRQLEKEGIVSLKGAVGEQYVV